MGLIMNTLIFSEDNNVLKPIIYCSANDEIRNSAISMNLLLAKKLNECKPTRRSLRIEYYFRSIIEEMPDDVILKEFDVLFNPEYKIDVLRTLITICKYKSFRVIWPGDYKDGKLLYSEEGYPDYKVFDLKEYDVTCII